MIGPLTYVLHYAVPYSDEAAEAVLRAVAEAVFANGEFSDNFAAPDWTPPDLSSWLAKMGEVWRVVDQPYLAVNAAEHTALSFAFSPTSEHDAVLRLQRDATGRFLAHLHVPRLALEETVTLRLYYRLHRANETRKRFGHATFSFLDYWEILPSEPAGFVGSTNLRAASTIRDALASALSVERTLARNWETELQPPPALKEKDVHAKLLRANKIVAEEVRRATEGGRPYIEIIEEQREEANRLHREALEAAHADIKARAEQAPHVVADFLDVPPPENAVVALSLFDRVLQDASLLARADALFADEHPAVRFEWHAAAFFGTAIRARWGGRWFQRSESNLHFVGPPDLSVLPHKCVARSREFTALYSLVRHYCALELLLTFDSVPSKPCPARPVADFREILRGEHIAKALFEDHLRSGSVRRHLKRTVPTDG
ncbi:MAG: hypothetical protein AAFP15_14310 [Bacteroidota bacterium]